MSAPLLIAAMLAECRATRPARKRHLLVRLLVATIAGAAVLAVSAPAVARGAGAEVLALP